MFPILNLPPRTIPLGHPSAPVLSILYPASNLDWRFISYMILYMFQCHSPKSSHPLPLPQSPKDCSIHLCLFCCLAYRVLFLLFNMLSRLVITFLPRSKSLLISLAAVTICSDFGAQKNKSQPLFPLFPI